MAGPLVKTAVLLGVVCGAVADGSYASRGGSFGAGAVGGGFSGGAGGFVGGGNFIGGGGAGVGGGSFIGGGGGHGGFGGGRVEAGHLVGHRCTPCWRRRLLRRCCRRSRWRCWRFYRRWKLFRRLRCGRFLRRWKLFRRLRCGRFLRRPCWWSIFRTR
ncbi:glycine-rich cell wall structural protein-like [Penaeus chinensis]|uniref:glycine-rich cell wall structural protein-like n=1 Tax=Penaeus chinensis TaxID=139456 RepID=UPI001FB7041B|nr:glycine-rich cell wall structural protein-like [Penaeus chinensis]